MIAGAPASIMTTVSLVIVATVIAIVPLRHRP
jgi:hypothetical protein